MFNLLRPVPIYIKLYQGKVEVSRLDSKQPVTRTVNNIFSNERLVVADSELAEAVIRTILRELNPPVLSLSKSWSLFPHLDIAIQQMEQIEGGLSQVERRVLMEIGENCGARKVQLIEGTVELTRTQVLKEIRSS